MKIVVFTKGRNHHNKFCNALHQQNELSLVVIEKGFSKETIVRKIRRHGIFKSFIFSIERIFNSTFNRIELNKNIERIYCNDINDLSYYKTFKIIDPDLVVVYGTSIIKQKCILSHPLILNVHSGLSPYYRGTHCIEWGIILRDFNNIGVTIHFLSEKIDGGGIVSQKKIKINIGLEKISIKNIDIAITDAAIIEVNKIIKSLKGGKKLIAQSQNFENGNIFLSSQWNTILEKYLYQQIRNINSKKTNIRASRESLKIVELKHE